MPKKLPPAPKPGSLKFRKKFSMPALLEQVKSNFIKLPDYRKKEGKFPLADVLMSGLAIFSLKDASLLEFDKNRSDPIRLQNLNSLYGINNIPCDTQLRTILDKVPPHLLRSIFVELHQTLQQQGEWEQYKFLGKYLVSMDGTGVYSSSNISCPECCVKHKGKDNESYYHQLLAAVMVHPDKKTVLPFYPEAITHQDGDNKNDCEHNAAARLIPQLHKDFPRAEFIALQDALACNGPHIKRLKEHNFSFIITAKPKSNSFLLSQVLAGLDNNTTQEMSFTREDGTEIGYRYANDISLNHTHSDLKVNFIDYWEIHPNRKNFLYACVTDTPLTADNVADVVRAGRTRWKVENETFNTLKNQGYNLEHNYGHGEKHLSTVFATLTFLAFFLDQIQETSCRYFQAARDRQHTRTGLWREMRALFYTHYISDWEQLYAALIWGHEGSQLAPHWNNTR